MLTVHAVYPSIIFRLLYHCRKQMSTIHTQRRQLQHIMHRHFVILYRRRKVLKGGAGNPDWQIVSIQPKNAGAWSTQRNANSRARVLRPIASIEIC